MSVSLQIGQARSPNYEKQYVTFGNEENDGEDERDEETETDDDDEQDNIADEFRNMLDLGREADRIPMDRVKALYLDLLREGNYLLADKAAASEYLSQLSPPEMAALMEVLLHDKEGVKRYFNDKEVTEAVDRGPLVPLTTVQEDEKPTTARTESEWDLSTEDEGDDHDDDEEAEEFAVSLKRSAASAAVQDALVTFEGNVPFFAQHPEELLKLSSQLGSPQEQTDLLDIIFHDYTPKKVQPMGGYVDTTVDITHLEMVDHTKVAVVFKDICKRFKEFKTTPEAFNDQLMTLNLSEREALDALVHAFWDVQSTDLDL